MCSQRNRYLTGHLLEKMTCLSQRHASERLQSIRTPTKDRGRRAEITPVLRLFDTRYKEVGRQRFHTFQEFWRGLLEAIDRTSWSSANTWPEIELVIGTDDP